eukprot:gnl/TRDRNA2_/TRDRNA2_194233_c0_seq1.p1 gnl/TRDRNA2_/TRDRNA2_194233_c0~~gnl/TRDRNA2_/TRDRNA2_194233_c0_seq1.p1  ORF type:complete len:218 (-),score=52.86 gnl/TRDRNA2_/TRDRNA2_194233_c0_seq1:94-747(-)
MSDINHMRMSDFEAKLEQLSLMASGGSSLQAFMSGFSESNFQADVQRFVTERAPAFQVACPDGSQPLVWTQYHQEYRGMFEEQLTRIITSLAMSEHDLREFCGWLQEYAENLEDEYVIPNSGGVRAGDFYPFLEALTASENYDNFLNVMFTEVNRQAAEQQAAPLAGQTQEIQVTVPEGMGPGQAIAVDYLGARYELVIPDGYGPGMTFAAAVTVAG